MRIVSLGLAMLLVACSSATSGLETQASPQSPSPTQDVAFNQGQNLPITAQTILGGEQIDLEVAATPEQQTMGLMFRTSLAANRGMLFSFQPPRPVRFWMKNTLIPLDMLFIHNGQIRYIARDVPPCKKDPCPTYGPNVNVEIDQVIELRAGRAKELNLKVGDRVPIRFIR